MSEGASAAGTAPAAAAVSVPAAAPARAARRRLGFVRHLHPPRVTLRALGPTATLGLGVATAGALAVATITGIVLMLYYVPTAGGAYSSIEDLQHAVPYGWLLRGLHRWSAHLATALVFLHLVRVAAMAAYHERRGNWWIGLGLLATVGGLAFTGYLLPWDQRSFWAVGVSTAMLDHVPLAGPALKGLLLGGATVSGASIVRFYCLHVGLLPAALVVLLALHLWRVRTAGGLARDAGTASEPPATVEAWPHLLLREAIVLVAVAAILVLVAAFVAAPLGPPPDPHRPEDPEKAPWYFLGLQEMVSYSTTAGGLVFPAALLALLVLLPLVDRDGRGVGRWFRGPGGRLEAGIGAAVALAGLAALEALRLAASSPSARLVASIVDPATGMLGLAALAGLVAGVRARSAGAAARLALVVVVVALVGFTVLGVLRGPGWSLAWPPGGAP